jgi:hypothetical protein
MTAPLSPGLVGEDELPKLEIPEHDPLEMDLVHGGHHLAEELAGHTLAEPAAGPHIRVEVAAAGRRKDQVESLLAHHHLLRQEKRKVKRLVWVFQFWIILFLLFYYIDKNGCTYFN